MLSGSIGLNAQATAVIIVSARNILVTCTICFTQMVNRGGRHSLRNCIFIFYCSLQTLYDIHIKITQRLMRVQTEAEASLTLSLASKSLNGCLYLYLYFMFAILINRYCSYIESEVRLRHQCRQSTSPMY